MGKMQAVSIGNWVNKHCTCFFGSGLIPGFSFAFDKPFFPYREPIFLEAALKSVENQKSVNIRGASSQSGLLTQIIDIIICHITDNAQDEGSIVFISNFSTSVVTIIIVIFRADMRILLEALEKHGRHEMLDCI